MSRKELQADGRDGWEEQDLGDDSRKPRRMEESLVAYLISLDKQLTSGETDVDEESRSLLINNVLTELKSCTASAACDRRINTIIEKICFVASMSNIIEILVRFKDYAVFLARNRHSSHVIQALLARMCSLLKGVGVETDEQEELLIEAFTGFARPILAELSWLAKELSASHVIRALICALVGMPVVSERKGKQSKHQHSVDLSEALDSLLEPKRFYISTSKTFNVPKSFRTMLHEALSSLLTQTTASLQDLVADTSSSAVLGLAMRALMCPKLIDGGEELGEKLARRILDWEASDEGAITGAPAFYGMSGDKAGSYYLESMIECGPLPLLTTCCKHALVGRAKEYAQDTTSNFVLQAVLRRLSAELERGSVDQIISLSKTLLKELLSPHVFPELVATKGGVVLWMIELATFMPKRSDNSSKKVDWADKIGRAVIGIWVNAGNSSENHEVDENGEDNAEGKVVALAAALTRRLSPKEAAQADAAQAPDDTKKKSKPAFKSAAPAPTDGRSPAQLLHARLVGALLKARGTSAASVVAAALVLLPAELLLHICLSGPLSRAIVDTFLDTVPALSIHAFLVAIQPHLVQLASHFLGQHIVRRAFESASPDDKHLIASTIASEKDSLKRSKEGRATVLMCNADLLHRDPAEWSRSVKRQARGSQILAELTTVANGKAEPSSMDAIMRASTEERATTATSSTKSKDVPSVVSQSSSNSKRPHFDAHHTRRNEESNKRKRGPGEEKYNKLETETKRADFEKISRLRGSKLGINLSEEIEKLQNQRKMNA